MWPLGTWNVLGQLNSPTRHSRAGLKETSSDLRALLEVVSQDPYLFHYMCFPVLGSRKNFLKVNTNICHYSCQ